MRPTAPVPDNGQGYTTETIAAWTRGRILATSVPDLRVDSILLDSRKLAFPRTTVFFALYLGRQNGHDFIGELYDRGVRVFVVSRDIELSEYPGACFIRVSDTLDALQSLTAAHRARFEYPVVGITGSNGKTVVKEWLNHLLSPDLRIVRSPKSYNSQTGVPLSVWQMKSDDQLGIFEAGISLPGEMERLERIIRPDIGIMTNIGEAHDEGFRDKAQKTSEKLRLFEHAGTLIYCRDHTGIHSIVMQQQASISGSGVQRQLLTWGHDDSAVLRIRGSSRSEGMTTIHALFRGKDLSISIPFTDPASLENAMHCWLLMLHLSCPHELIRERMLHLPKLAMRLELREGINRCSVINDSYNADRSSLQIALDFLDQQQQHPGKTVILSDILQSGMDEHALYTDIAYALARKKVQRLIGIGPAISAHAALFRAVIPVVFFHPTTDAFIEQFHPSDFRDETILLKGSRSFAFERIARELELRMHQTLLEIDMTVISRNLARYRQMLHPGTRLMVMVKAFSYGAGAFEIANLLQFHRVDWLAVAYTDEGVELRKAGIRLPIMVMNPEISGFRSLTDHDLQPEIYSFEIATAFDAYLRTEGIYEYPVHIKLDTGMHRLGFLPEETDRLGRFLSGSGTFRVQTVFSHLVASEDPKEDDYTERQSLSFISACRELEAALGYGFLRHLANTAAIRRHPTLQMDMVRLGIGLYGIDPGSPVAEDLQEALCLRTTVAQIKQVPAGETVGYNRRGKVNRDSRIATIRIGYADGYPRSLSNGIGKVLIGGRRFPVIGNICMDMTMIDITGGDDIQVGDQVIVFGLGLPVTEMAGWAGTIPYEILTGISRRVQRIYFEE